MAELLEMLPEILGPGVLDAVWKSFVLLLSLRIPSQQVLIWWMLLKMYLST